MVLVKVNILVFRLFLINISGGRDGGRKEEGERGREVGIGKFINIF